MSRAQLTGKEWGFGEPYLPVGGYGPYPERLRQQFEGVGAWSTAHNRFRQWRDAGVFEALLEGVIAEAAERHPLRGPGLRARDSKHVPTNLDPCWGRPGRMPRRGPCRR